MNELEEELLSISQLEIGNHYHCDWNYKNEYNDSVAIIYIEEPISENHSNFTLLYKAKRFSSDGCLTALSNKFRLATLSEIKWFDKCKEAGKFVEEDSVLFSNIPDELLNGVIYTHKNGNIVRWGDFSHLGNDCKTYKKSMNVGHGFSGIPSNYTFSTNNERDWLIACETAGKFVKFEDRYKMQLPVKESALTKADLIDNFIYYHTCENYEYVFRFDSGRVLPNTVLVNFVGYKSGFITDNKWERDSGWNDFKVGEIRLPTSKEKEWFLKCERFNKFVSLDSIGDNDLLPETNSKFRTKEENDLIKISNNTFSHHTVKSRLNELSLYPLTSKQCYKDVDTKSKLYIKPQLKVVEPIIKNKIKLKQVKLIRL